MFLAVICGIAPCINHTVWLYLIGLVTNTKFTEGQEKRGDNCCVTQRKVNGNQS